VKSCLLFTLYRRYHELEQNLWYIRTHLFRELDEIPSIVLVYARPEPERLEFIKSLALTHVIYRDTMPLESEANTTYPESWNIRIGLTYIRDNIPCDYVLFHTVDVFPKEGTYKLINDEMSLEETNVVSFKWDGYTRDTKHTNIWAIKTKSLETYWPPIIDPEEFHSLEMHWLRNTQLPGIKIIQNPFDYFFTITTQASLRNTLKQEIANGKRRFPRAIFLRVRRSQNSYRRNRQRNYDEFE